MNGLVDTVYLRGATSIATRLVMQIKHHVAYKYSWEVLNLFFRIYAVCWGFCFTGGSRSTPTTN